MGVAPAIIIRKEKDLVAHFRNARAVSAATAQGLGALRVDDDSMAMRRLLDRAVIRQGAPGTYYLDEPTWEALRRLRHRLAAVLFIVVVLAAAVGFLSGAWAF